MENEEKNKEVVVKEIIREVPKENKKVIKIKLANPIKLAIYGIIIFILLGGVVFGVSKTFQTNEKVLKLGLEDVGELVTQTCHTVVLEDSKDNRTFFKLFDIPFTESRQIFSYDFDVDASINFSKITSLGIDNGKKEISIKIPHAKIYKVVILLDTFNPILDQDNLFSRIDINEHNEALVKMEEKAKNQCLASKVLERADENAEKLISAMIKSEKKYKDYVVKFDYYDEIDETNSAKEGETNEKN